ncbi:MAG: hypothetical protein B7X90_11485 [Novosphingobium sp. 17-62-19]|uniref:hypothetical protein n=1 Tax=Novosphingobium sp. 17-62-19 TaxID=1970406 RepID=UPI000BDA7A40|nr:hypothetical protein [Novosphingobium sp. 17-62-19]OZA18651.1 MAG: hypothetical protein B7X90_11485 [Novosphingobium sp. 17-62-19]HQS96711.1 hypothetical protein [Novosphingobium sp.]
MTDIAFLGDPAIKAQALSRLRSHIAAETFVIFPAWEDGKANVIGALVEADDKQAFASQYGYPIAFVTALEGIVNAFRFGPSSEGFVKALLERTPVGADLSRIVPHVLIALLERPDIVALTGQNTEVERWRLAIVALHQRTINGDEPDRKEWKAARMASISASDAVVDNTASHMASLIVEAAAWPATMRTVLHDTLGACGRLESHQIMNAIGWTEADESRVFKIREQAEADGRLAELSGLDRVLGLLDADDPDLARGFRERLEQFEKLGETYRAVGWQIVDLIERSPVPTSPPENVT